MQATIPQVRIEKVRIVRLLVYSNGPHTANCNWCVVYKELQRTRLNNTTPRRQQVSTTIHTHEYQQVRENLTYSQAVKANTQLEELTNVLNRTISEFLDRFENMTNRLMNQHNTIINLLTALIKILKISIDNIVRIALRNANRLPYQEQEI